MNINQMRENPVLKIRPFVVRELKWETADIYTLVLAPQDPADMIQFKPGQWVYLHLMNGDGSTWARAAFSIATAPEASKNGLELGIKVYGDFTKRGAKLMPDDVVGIQGPFGVFTLHEGVSPLVMIAGGIGIVPLLCMIRSLYLRRADIDVVLFYSNRTEEDIAYWEELERMSKDWPRLKPVYVLTRSSPPGWTGETGRIDAAMLKKYLSDLSQGEFLMCGPKEFMTAMRGLLASEGVDTKKRLREEKFH